MNALAGFVIGLIADNYPSVIEYSIYWAILHVAYGYLFGMHDNSVVNSSKEGNPMASYYGARFMTGLLTTGVVAILTVLVTRLVGAA